MSIPYKKSHPEATAEGTYSCGGYVFCCKCERSM